MSFNSSIKCVREHLQRFSIVVIERTSLLRLLIVFGGVIVAFALMFTVLGGLRESVNGSPVATASFWDNLYFSVVTIASLGYGDVLPVGWSRFFASLEVLIGLGIMGIIVAKLSSARLSHHVRRLYGTDTTVRLRVLEDEFAALTETLPKVTATAVDAFAEVPVSTDAERENKHQQTSETEVQFGLLIDKFYKHSLAMKEYVGGEIEHGVFFDDAPAQSIQRTGERVDEVVCQLTLFIKFLPVVARMRLLQSSNRRRLLGALDFHQTICGMVNKNSKDNEVLRVFGDLSNSCLRFPQEMFNFPEVKASQPDQAVVDESEPQDDGGLPH